MPRLRREVVRQVYGSGQSTVGQGSSTRLVRSKTRTTRSVEVVYSARPGIAPPPRAWSIRLYKRETGVVHA